jgi:probable rRNA maturation factor
VAPAPDADRSRRLYVGPWRIDLTRREGTSQVLTDRAIAQTAAAALDSAVRGAVARGSVAIVLTDDAELADLNSEHLHKPGTTDVLSFPMLPPEAFVKGGRANARQAVDDLDRGGRIHLGDIAISVERAIAQAESGAGGQTGDVRWAPADELRLLVTHGVLHICGWDHAGSEEVAEMRALERQLLGRPAPRDSRRPNDRPASRRAGPVPPSTARASRRG